MAVEIRVASDPIAHFDEAIPLLEANWEESNMPIDFIADDARKVYQYMTAQGILFAVGAYDDDEMVGYCIATIAPHPFNHVVMMVNIDGIYLKPQYRKGRAGVQLMSTIREMAKKRAAYAINWHAPAGSDFAKTLERSFTPLNNYYTEKLGYE